MKTRNRAGEIKPYLWEESGLANLSLRPPRWFAEAGIRKRNPPYNISLARSSTGVDGRGAQKTVADG